jgi:hydrogenase-4 component B
MGTDGLLLAAVFALCAAGALAGFIAPDRRNPALLAWTGSLAAAAAMAVAGRVLWSGSVYKAQLWSIVPLGRLTLSVDRLSALFLFAAAVVVMAACVFSAGYLRRYSGRYSLRAMNAWSLLLIASIVLILIADDALLFLLAWEAMSLTSYLLVNFEHRRDEGSRAGYLMLKAAALGIAAILAEGAASGTARTADVVVGDIRDALELLPRPLRLAATLRPRDSLVTIRDLS